MGEEQFSRRLHHEHALTAGAPELWRYGLHLQEETQEELAALAARMGSRPWRELVEELRGDAPESEALLPFYQAEMDRAHAFIAERELVSIPRDPVEVVPTPKFLVALVPFAAYEPPPIFLSNQTGRFYVTQPDPAAPPEVRARQRKGHCRHAIPAMVAHEAYPGHHLQLVTAQGLTSEVRRHVWTPVMVEGWALYCEQLMEETGYYERRPSPALPPGESPLAGDPDRARRGSAHPRHGAGGGGGLHGGAPADRAGPARRPRCAATARIRPTSCATRSVGASCCACVTPTASARARRSVAKTFHDELLAYGGLPVALARWGMELGEE